MNNNVYLKLENVKNPLLILNWIMYLSPCQKATLWGLLVQMVLEKPPQLNSF